MHIVLDFHLVILGLYKYLKMKTRTSRFFAIINQSTYKKNAVILFALLVFGTTFIHAETISTTSQGGLWRDESTWVGGNVPTENDDVVITSTVTTGDVSYSTRYLEMASLTINEGGKIIREAERSGYYIMKVFGNLTNNGEIIDYKDYFDVQVYGNIVNNGVLKPRYLSLLGENQHISGSKPIGAKTFNLQMSDETVVAASDLHFHNCDIKANTGKKLDMKTFNLKLSADSITYSSYYGQMYSACISRVPLIFESTGIIEVDKSILGGIVQGNVRLKSPTYAFLNDLTIEGDLTIEESTKASSDENLTKLKVTGKFVNSGELNNDSVQVGNIKFPPRSMYLTVYGNAANYGSTGITKLFMTTNGETLTIQGDYAGDVKFQQSEGNETPGGKILINEEVNISGKVEVYAPVEIAEDGTLNLLYRKSSPIYIREGQGEVINNGNMYRYYYLNNSWNYRAYNNQPGTFVDFELRDWEDRIEGVEVAVFNNQTYPALPGSTKRWWRINPEGEGEVTEYLIKFYYDDALLNGQKEENLKVYRSVDEGETWEVVSFDEYAVLDTVENFISIGVWNKHESLLKEFGDFVISAGDGSVPIANNFEIDMIGRPDVRIGAPNPFTIHVYNVTDFFTGPIMLAMNVSEDVRFKEFHLPYNDGVEIIPVDSTGNPDDFAQVFFIPYLEPNEHYSFDVILYGIPESMKSAEEDWISLLTGGFYGSDDAKGDAVDYIVEEVGNAAELNDAEKEEYARGLGLTVNQLKSEKNQYGRTISFIRDVTKDAVGKVAEKNPLTNLVFKIGEGVEAVASIKDKLRRRLFHWFYKETGLYGVEEKVVSGKHIKGELVSSWDPNEIVGPAGFGEQNHIAEIPRMNYTIYFENKKEATAPAYRIQIIDTLSALFNPETVEFAETSHSGTGYNWIMERDGNILKWDIEGIELPPNVTPPEGEGFVRFSVELNEGLTSGTVIENRATIIFDMNPPITTNTWVNVLDFEAPVTTMSGIAYSAGDTLITVSCSASDNENGAGVGMYEFFASVDNGPFRSLGQSAENSIVYSIPDSTKNNYRFYALVTDNVGNAEKTVPEYAELNSLLVNAGFVDNHDGDLMVFPIPASNMLTVLYPGIPFETFTVEIRTITGQLVYSEIREGVSLSGGITINTQEFLNGHYILRVFYENQVLSQKIVIKK